MKLKLNVLLAILVLCLCVSACGTPSSSSSTSGDSSTNRAQEYTNLITPTKIDEIGLFSIYYFNYGDDECYVVIDEESTTADSSSLQCTFGQELTRVGNSSIKLTTLGLYSVYYLSRNNDECYVIIDEESAKADSSSLRCSI